MFTVYIDDSGSSPEHKVVVASAVIFPAEALLAFEEEWNRFLADECIPDFHTSICVARNPKSVFAEWDEQRVYRALDRARAITLKHSSQAFCIAIFKKDYDELMPEEMRNRIGSYFTWAVSSVLGLSYDWSSILGVQVEYVFDTAEKHVQREIDETMEYAEQKYTGHFSGKYRFRKRTEVPALQAADLFAWTCYQAARCSRLKHPISELAQKSWEIYRGAYKGRWLIFQSLNREGLEKWVQENYMSPPDLQLKKFKDNKKETRKPKRRTT